MGMMDPVPLATLGEAMKDAAWLDMRIVEHGNVPRVRVQSILVTPHNDIVELYQELPGEDFRHLEVDGEDIMGAVPSCFEREDVPEPVNVPPVDPGVREDRWGRKYELKTEARLVFPFVRTAVFDQFGGLPGDMEKRWLDPNEGLYSFSVHVRYALVWVLYELTELSPMDVCRTVGYHSVQPLLSAKTFLKGEDEGRKQDRRLGQVVKEAYLDAKHALGPRVTAPKRHDSRF